MKLRILTLVLAAQFGIGVSHAETKQPKHPKPHYHCDCADICAKAPPREQCELKRCNGMDVRRVKASDKNSNSPS